MSNLDRLERIIKSRLPRFPKTIDYTYSIKDARNMINDLGLSLSPEALAYLTETETVLDDFLEGIYHVENKFRKRVASERAILKEEFSPQVYEEDSKATFTLTYRDKEYIFAEYELP
ncbi:MAG: hypothetical protein AAF824_06995 [Bacteroidota bacterium]